MRNKNLFIIITVLLLFSCVKIANSQDIINVSYPIPELGNCASKAECKAFCDEPEHYVLCTQWAAEHKIVPKEKVVAVQKEVEQIEKFQSGEITQGPGGCRTPEECNIYCENPEHFEECLKFGTEHNLISPKEVERIKKKLEASKGPGGCKNNEDCNIYCSKPEHTEECIRYAVQDGTLTPQEAEELLRITLKEREIRETMPPQPEEFHPKSGKPKVNKEKVEEILKTQKGPGDCSTLKECEEYCQDINHAEECLAFAEENNLFAPEELKEIKTMLESGGPGGCKGPKECDEYCSKPEHQKECLEYAKKHNLITPEEAKVMEKMAGGGPGGCRNQQECDAYCRDPNHMEECLMFSVKQGFMSEEDAQKMIEIMRKQEERGMQMKGKPPVGGPEIPPMFKGGMPKQNEWPTPEAHPRYPEPGEQPMPNGNFIPSPPENNMPPEMKPLNEQMPPQQIMTGPGGCRTKAECDAYCAQPEHMEECMNFSGGNTMKAPEQPPAPEGGSMPPLEQTIPSPEQNIPPLEETMPPEGVEEQTPPEESSQSLFNRLENFLANIGALFKFKIKRAK